MLRLIFGGVAPESSVLEYFITGWIFFNALEIYAFQLTELSKY